MEEEEEIWDYQSIKKVRRGVDKSKGPPKVEAKPHLPSKQISGTSSDKVYNSFFFRGSERTIKSLEFLLKRVNIDIFYTEEKKTTYKGQEDPSEKGGHINQAGCIENSPNSHPSPGCVSHSHPSPGCMSQLSGAPVMSRDIIPILAHNGMCGVRSTILCW